MTETATQQLALHQRHQALDARFVPFAGYQMPLRYGSILDEHRAVRTGVGLFDVSHMGEVEFTGAKAGEVLNELITNDLSKLVDGQALYTVMCNPEGGIIDDLIVYRLGDDHFLACVNAANRPKDAAHMQQSVAGRCQVVDRSDQYVQLAIQGPSAVALMERIAGPSVSSIGYYHCRFGQIAGARVLISRTGYTGEDGFELYYPVEAAEPVYDLVWENGRDLDLRMCGLAARDMLRLEARMLLYGNDMDDRTTPLEAGLGWVVKFDKPAFIGREALLAQKESGPLRRLRGFILETPGVLRPHYPVYLGDRQIGETTSGGPSPTLGKSIALGYVESACAKEKRVEIEIRSSRHLCTMTTQPFYKRSGGDS
ncbi:MAG: glycine cleavage system aminomethyltransferase GcvT [Bradymonadales bacterium]|nr:glycine cleavage system aminomethyltransferase GcvT [Bradymonadales bacterium]